MHVPYERVSWTGQARVTVENAVYRLYSGLEGCPWLEMCSMLTRRHTIPRSRGDNAVLAAQKERLQPPELSRDDVRFRSDVATNALLQHRAAAIKLSLPHRGFFLSDLRTNSR